MAFLGLQRRGAGRDNSTSCDEKSHEFQPDRLVVRSARTGDLDALVALCDDEELRYIQGFTAMQQGQLEEMFSAYLNSTTEETLAIVERSTGDVIGWRTVSPMSDNLCMIGTGLRKDRRRRGFGTEELTGLLPFLHHHVGYRGVLAACDDWNAASRRQMEKAGMSLAQNAPTDFLLPDGRQASALWYSSVATRPRANCARRLAGWHPRIVMTEPANTDETAECS